MVAVSHVLTRHARNRFVQQQSVRCRWLSNHISRATSAKLSPQSGRSLLQRQICNCKVKLIFKKYFILQLYCANGISPIANSGCLPRGKPAATQTVFLFVCFHNPTNSDADYWIFNVPTDINARDYTQGCMDTVRESALKVDSERKNSCRIGESNQRRRRAGPMLYQLSYIPIQLQTCTLQQQLFFFFHLWGRVSLAGAATLSFRYSEPEFYSWFDDLCIKLK